MSATLISATPILFTGLAAAAAFRMQLFNIGAEGQLYLGAIGASWIALQLGDRDVTSTPLFVVAMCVAAAVLGALWALIPGVLRAFARTNEIITSLMLNYVAASPHLPDLRQLVLLARHVDASGSVVPARQADARCIQLADLRLVGRRPARVSHRACRRAWRLGALFAHAVRVRGERDGRLAPRRALLGHANAPKDPRGHGPLGRTGGDRRASQIGDFTYTLDGSPTGLQAAAFGYTGIVVAALARYNPFAVCLVAVLIGGLLNAGYTLQGPDFPSGLVGVMQGIILFCALGGELLLRYRLRFKALRAGKPVAEGVL